MDSQRWSIQQIKCIIGEEMKYKYHKDGTLPDENADHMMVFVFGSNLAGIHGAGAAKKAMQSYGAEYGKGIGLHGESYAIPTKDKNIETMSLDDISMHVDSFKRYANQMAKLNIEFFITRIGCGLAGYKDSDIAPLFIDSPTNCNFPKKWKEYLE